MNRMLPNRSSRLPHRFRRAAARSALAVCLVAATICLACGDDEPVTLSPICVGLVPAALAPSASPFVLQTGSGTSCNKLVMEIVANGDFTDVLSMNLEFRYPLITPLSLDPEFSPPEAGAIWTADGAPITFDVDESEPEPGFVTLAISRTSPSPAIAIPAGTVLARLSFFQAVTGGSGIVTFLDGSLLDAGDGPLVPPVAVSPEITTDTFAGEIRIAQ
jgi:hypothetical protein